MHSGYCAPDISVEVLTVPCLPFANRPPAILHACIHTSMTCFNAFTTYRRQEDFALVSIKLAAAALSFAQPSVRV